VEPERPACSSRLRSFQPHHFVLTVRRIGRAHQRNHVETARTAPLEGLELRPGRVLERLLEMAGDGRDGP
jgi:hypothetical protein